MKTALDAPKHLLGAQDETFLYKIREHGFHVTNVFEDEHGPGFCYTTNLFNKLDFPEVIVFGLDPEAMHQLCCFIYSELEAGSTFEIGVPVDNILNGYEALLLPVSKSNYANYLGWSRWFYGGDSFECVQLVWPDKTGAFPWSMRDDGIKGLQPDLTSSRWAGHG